MSENGPLLSHRRCLYHLAEVYDRAVIRAWTTRDVAGMEDEHRRAMKALEVARRRLDRAGRGLSIDDDKADYRDVSVRVKTAGEMAQAGVEERG